MKSDYIENTITFAAILARLYPDALKSPSAVAQDAIALQKLGRQADSNAIALSNAYRNQDAFAKRCKSIAKRAADILEPYGLRANVGGDPRGYCLKITAAPGQPAIPHNTWGGAEYGYGI